MLYIIFFFLISNTSFGQNFLKTDRHQFSYRDSLNLYYLGLDIKNRDYNELKLYQVLTLHKKSKLNNVIGSVFRSIGYLWGGAGTLLIITAPAQDGMARGLSVIFGISFLSIGAIDYGISVPFKRAAKKRAFERDLSIQKMNEKN